MEISESLNASGSLFGIVNMPELTDTPDVAILFINAGFLHRVGPYRLHTDLARKLGIEGIASLRFDLSGLGDSLTDPDLTLQNNQLKDIQAAMNFMESKYSISKFIVCGLCSGADDSLDAAIADSRIVGTLLIDGPGFRAGKFYLYYFTSHIVRRIFSLQKMQSLFRRLLSKLFTRDQAPVVRKMDDEIRREIGENELRSMTAQLLERNVSMLYVYTGGVSDYYNHDRQFDMMFPEFKGHPLLQAHYLPDNDHLCMLTHHRDALQELATAWVKRVTAV